MSCSAGAHRSDDGTAHQSPALTVISTTVSVSGPPTDATTHCSSILYVQLFCSLYFAWESGYVHETKDFARWGGTPYPLIVLVASSHVTTDFRKYAWFAMWQAAAA